MIVALGVEKGMNSLRTAALMGFLFALLTGIGLAIGGRGGLWIGLAVALVTNGIAFFYSDKIALAGARARPLAPNELPDLHATVAELSQNAGIPMPRLYVMPGLAPNAFATGRSPSHAALAVNEGLLRSLPRDELRGVLAHEIAHIRNRDILTQSIAAAIGGAVSFLVQMAAWGGGRDSEGRRANPLVVILALFVAPITATLVQLALSRTREYAADHDGALIARDANGLAKALARIDGAAGRNPMEVPAGAAPMYIVNPLGGDTLKGLLRTHPPIAERIARLRDLERDSVAAPF